MSVYFYLTWYETEKAEIIENILDDRMIPIFFVPTPPALLEKDIMLCKDCFVVKLSSQEMLSSFQFPELTKCFNQEEDLLCQW